MLIMVVSGHVSFQKHLFSKKYLDIQRYFQSLICWVLLVSMGKYFLCRQGVLGGSSSLFKSFALDKSYFKKNNPGIYPTSLL